MKPISELLDQMDQLDAQVPEYEAPVSFVGTTESSSEEPSNEPTEAVIDELPGEPTDIDEPRDIEDPTQPSVTVEELPENQEPSVAVNVEPDPVVPEVEVAEEQAAEVPESSVESVDEPSVTEPTVEEVSSPDTSDPFVEESGPQEQPDVDQTAEEIVEPNVPESSVDQIPAMPDTTSEVGLVADVEHEPISIEQFNLQGEYADAPSQEEIDRQVEQQVSDERARGDDLAARLHSELREMVLDATSAREQTAREVVGQEMATLALMQET